jgi:hypothetical protein
MPAGPVSDILGYRERTLTEHRIQLVRLAYFDEAGDDG